MSASPMATSVICSVLRTGRLLQHGPNFYSERIWDHHGVPLDFYFNPSYNFNFKARTYFSVNFSMGQDRLRPIDYST